MRKNAFNDFYYMISIEELKEKINKEENLEEISNVLKAIKKYKLEFGKDINEIAIDKYSSIKKLFKVPKEFRKSEIELVKMHVENPLKKENEKYIKIINEILENSIFSYKEIKEKYGEEVFNFIDEHRDNVILRLDDKFSPQKELDTSVYYLDDRYEISRINLYEELMKKKL